MTEYILYMIVVLGGASLLVVMIAGITAYVSTRSEGDFRSAFNTGLDFFAGTNNRRWLVLLVITVFTTVMAITHPGDGLVKPLEGKAQNEPLRIELNEVREKHYNLRDYGLYKTNAEMCAESSDFSKKNQHICASREEVRTWVWWWLTMTFLAVLLVYAIPAFWDDLWRAGRRTYARLRVQAGGEARFKSGSLIDRLFGGRGRSGKRGRSSAAPTPETQVPPQAPIPGAQPQHPMSFLSVMMASLIPEIFVNILEWMMPRKRRG